jgi:hypothetical protein
MIMAVSVSVPLPVPVTMVSPIMPMATGMTYAVGALILILLAIRMRIGAEKGLVTRIDRLYRHIHDGRRNIGRHAMDHARRAMHHHRRLMHYDRCRIVAR